MFSNATAIETLVSSDALATEDEKRIVLSSLRGQRHDDAPDAQVLSIGDAAAFIGKPRKSIYHLLRNGTLKGFYSGKKRTRATGVTRASLEAAVCRSKR